MRMNWSSNCKGCVKYTILLTIIVPTFCTACSSSKGWYCKLYSWGIDLYSLHQWLYYYWTEYSVLSLPTELITSIAIYHVVLSITDCILTLISYMVQKHGKCTMTHTIIVKGKSWSYINSSV